MPVPKTNVRGAVAFIVLLALVTFVVAPISAVAKRARAVANASPSPVTSPAAGGKGAPANPASPGGAPSPAQGEATSDPCGGPGRLLATLNRPTVGYSACAVPAGSVVLEEGYQNQAQGGASPNVVTTYPQGFERIGVAQRLEIDAIGPNFNRVRSGSDVATGYSDLGFGFKYEFPQRGRFTYGVDGLFTAASGQRGFTAGGPTETANFDIAYAASPAVGFGTTLGAASSAGFTVSGNGARFGYLIPSLVATAQIPNYYQFYAELVTQTKLAPDQGGRIFTDFGIQKLLGPNVEFDVEYGASFTPIGGSRFHYLGAGAGIRVK